MSSLHYLDHWGWNWDYRLRVWIHRETGMRMTEASNRMKASGMKNGLLWYINDETDNSHLNGIHVKKASKDQYDLRVKGKKITLTIYHK